jgi:excinuclease UvrABC nuclease subunit
MTGLEREMRAAAANLEFERAAQLRDRLKKLRSPGGATGGR